jgi:23S rRNA pseudouridine1911/1915/1917 synthase
MEIEIVFEDDYFLIVNKPAGITSVANNNESPCILQFFKHPVFPVHRLDQRVNGLLVLAKTADMQTKLTVAMQHESFKKKYLAVVSNKPAENTGTITHWLLKNNTAKKVKAFKKPVAHAVQATLQYKVLQSSLRYHLLEINLHNGKFHQIRAQLAAIGSPIVGDVKYGYKRTTKDGSIFLQSHQIQCIHPVSKQLINPQLPLPIAWQQYGIV